jgi:uncharacterized protein (TIGR02453 family)
MAKGAATKFGGFDPQAMQFWHELAAEMNRDWFLANKERYETLWAQPMQALLDDVAPKLAKVYAPLKLSPPKVMRIHRDVRFSKDKAPYKTHIGAVISLAGKSMTGGGHAAMYAHLGLDEEFVGVGCYFFDGPQLGRWRKAVTGKPGVALDALVKKLRAKSYEVGGHDDYKKVPKPFDPEHPRAEFLKMKGLTAGPPPMPKGMLHKPDLAGWLVEHGVALAPLVTWLAKTVK